jgi:hypothetical protein
MIVYLVGVEIRRSDIDVEQVVAAGELQGTGFRQREGAASRMLVMYSDAAAYYHGLEQRRLNARR